MKASILGFIFFSLIQSAAFAAGNCGNGNGGGNLIDCTAMRPVETVINYCVTGDVERIDGAIIRGAARQAELRLNRLVVESDQSVGDLQFHRVTSCSAGDIVVDVHEHQIFDAPSVTEKMIGQILDRLREMGVFLKTSDGTDI